MNSSPTLVTLLILHILTAAAAVKCKPPTTPCPPFTSLISYPFSASPGCGHPHFQIRCSAPHSTISINNLSFAILRHDPNSSLTLTPLPHHSTCTSSLPSHSLNLSASPFRFSDRSCSRLSVVNPCPNPNPAPPCTSLCRFECELLKTPFSLLHGCQHNRLLSSDQGCKPDVLDYLKNLVKMGFEVEWNLEEDAYFKQCKLCRADNGTCGYDAADPHKMFLCLNSSSSLYSHSREVTPWIRRDNPNRIVLLCVCAVLFSMVGVVTAIFRYRRVNYPKNEEDPTMLFLHRQRPANLLPPMFNFDELNSATNCFDSRRMIGDGGFGSVYLGQLYDNRIVAVKKLHTPPQSVTRTTSEKAFCNEILILSSIQHPNLVKLHGYCSDSRGLLLVYDYVPNGTLADHLHTSVSSNRKAILTWQLRVEIALQTALALEYLHFGVKPAIVHRDITSSNIFLEKDLRIKLGDFGLSRLLICSETSSSSSGSGFICTGPQGTPGYLDPDYHKSSRLTEKSDVYSFGVVLFELLSGLRAVDLERDKRDVALADLVVSRIQVGSLDEVVDPVLIVEGEAIGTVESVAELAFRCVACDKDDRPNAREIVAELKRIKNRIR